MRPDTTAWRLILSALLMLCLLPVAHAAPIGAAVVVVNNVTGKVERTQAGMPLHVGIDVLQDETVETASESATKLIFQDNTQFEVGPTSQVTLDRFIFDPDPGKSQVALSIARGTARFVTGYLPKSDYAIRTPAATIGIRGTILHIDVAANGATTVYVEKGIAFVTGNGATVELQAGQTTIVFRGSVPSTPNGVNPPPANVIQTLLQRAEHSPAGAAALVRGILALHPEGGPELIDIVAAVLEQDPFLAPAFVDFARGATTAQQLALGTAFAQAAAYFANNGDNADQQQIITAMTLAPLFMQTAFADAGGRNQHTIALVTTVTGTSNSGTSTCVSPSRPGGRC